MYRYTLAPQNQPKFDPDQIFTSDRLWPPQVSDARIFEVHRSDPVIHRRFIYGESIMPQTQRSQVQPVKLRCRFEMTAADAPSSHEFCVFEFPGCEGCPKAQHTVRTVGSSEDPMKSEALRAWVAHASRPKKEFFVPIREVGHGEVHSQGEPYPVQETSR
jgi:hypothetical protein